MIIIIIITVRWFGDQFFNNFRRRRGAREGCPFFLRAAGLATGFFDFIIRISDGGGRGRVEGQGETEKDGDHGEESRSARVILHMRRKGPNRYKKRARAGRAKKTS